MNICLAAKNDVSEIAKIHEEEIKEGFLSSLKTAFLRKFYEAIVDSKDSFCIVAREGNIVTGFVSGVADINIFYNYFFKNYFFILIPVFLPKIFDFNIIKKVVENIFYPKKTKNFPSAELLTMAVKREFQGKGTGSHLLQRFVSEMEKRQIKIFKVLVGKEMDALNFYKKNGFQQIEEINLHGDESSIVLIYKT